MAKQSKRQRKFNASGGVKKRLEKGTITKKGKLRAKRKRTDDKASSDDGQKTAAPKRDRSDDFMDSQKMAGMDLDQFFTQISEAIESEKGMEENEDVSQAIPKKAKTMEEEPSQSSASDDDDDESDASSDEGEDSNVKEPKSKKGGNSRDDDSSHSDADSDSDDEDIEAAEKRMKEQMAKLTKSDPEFHEFLQENEQSLLEFGDEEEGVQEEDESDDEENKKSTSQGSLHLTLKELKKLETGVFEGRGMKSLKKLMTAYRCACHLADSSEDKGTRPGESGVKYIIDSSAVFDRLMVTCLDRCHEIFNHHLFPKEEDEEEDADQNKPIDPKKLEKADSWSEMSKILNSFFASTLHIMSEAKEPELLTFVLKALSNYMVYLSAFPRVAEAVLKSLVEKWSAPLDTSQDYQVVRLNAFFRIRQLAKVQPFPFIELCLKKTYLAYARRAKHGKTSPTAEVLSTLTFMGNSLVELYSLDLHSSYQHAFVYIRQLALHLRTAIQKPSQETLRQVFSWQYLHCLKAWVAILSDLVASEDGTLMKSLIYPLTEVIYGAARLAPTQVRNFPFRLHCVRLLQQLAAASEMFMPTTSLLLDCLDWKEWYLRPKKTKKKTTTKGFDMISLLKLPKDEALRTSEQLESGITAIFQLLEREVDLYSYTAGFPEYSMWIRRRLKSFNRETKQQRWRRFSEGVIDTCEKHSREAMTKRSKLSEAPKDVKMLECLRPPSAPTMNERHKRALDKEAKRILATTPPAGKTPAPREDPSDSEEDDSSVEETVKVKKGKKASKKKLTKSTGVKAKENPAALDQEDEVQEGINWSDDEEE